MERRKQDLEIDMVKYKTSMKEMVFLFCLVILCGGVFTACTNSTDKIGSQIAEDGRSYGGLIQGEAGDKMETAFFDVTVENAVRYDTYQFDDGLYQAEDGNTYLVVTFTIKNTYDEAIPMSITDFTLDYEGNQSKDIITGYGKADLNKADFMDNIFTLKKGESVTKSVLFTVKNKKNYTLNYTEYYEDDFKGDSFSIKLEPEKISAIQETSTETQQDATTTAENSVTAKQE